MVFIRAEAWSQVAWLLFPSSCKIRRVSLRKLVQVSKSCFLISKMRAKIITCPIGLFEKIK